MATILVIDDSAFARRLLCRILESAGHEVIEAGSGRAGLEAYALHRPALVMLDLMMPDMPGLEVLQELRRVDEDVVVIVVSADVQRPVKLLAEQCGACDFLAKPYTGDDVLAAVGRALHDEYDASD